MADMKRIKGRIAETIYPNGTGAITAESHQALLLDMVDDINAKKADKEEVTTVAESVSMLSQEVESNYNNFTESLDALEQKVDNLPQGGGDFDAKGNYPLLHVGTADDLAGRGESVPAEFGFRASGGKSIKDGRAYIKRIKGNSVVWNQKYPDDWTITQYGITSKSINGLISIEGTAETTITQFKQFTANELNHKYLFVLSGASSQMEGKRLQLHNRNISSVISGGYAYLFHNNTDNSKGVYFGLAGLSVGDIVSEHNIRVNQYDLTQMFQAGNEPTTIEDFNARVATLGVDMNAYNEGQVIHCNTESIKSVGDNAWDGVLETSLKTSKIRCLSNEQYCLCGPYYNKGSHSVIFYDSEDNEISRLRYLLTFFLYNNKKSIFTTPANCAYFVIEFNANYPPSDHKDQIVISIYHTGWKSEVDNTYKPYWQDTLPLPIIRKYFPNGMKSAGSAHDEIRYNKASGKWEYSKGKIKSVDLGTLNWKNLDASNGMFYISRQEVIDLNMATHDNENIPTNLISSLYASAPTYDIVNIDKVFRGPFTTKFSGYLTIKDTSYTDAATFKAAMAGVMLYYEAADWEWVELDAEDQNFRDYYNVADFGTEQSQSSVPSAPFSADIIYQFNAVDMIREHEIEITELQQVIATMQAQLTSLINGGQ